MICSRKKSREDIEHSGRKLDGCKDEQDNLDIGVVPVKVTLTPKLVHDKNKGKTIYEQSKNCNNGLSIPNNS